MMRPNASVEKVYLYPKPVDFRKSIDGLAALVELDIKVAVFDPVGVLQGSCRVSRVFKLLFSLPAAPSLG